MTFKRSVLTFVLTFLLALPLTFPAPLLARWVALPAGVSLAPLDGSLFAVRTDWLEFKGIRLNSVSVSPSLPGVFSGTPLALTVEAPVQASARLGGSERALRLSTVEASSRFEALRPLLGLPGLGIDAAMTLELDTLELLDGRCESLEGQLQLSEFEGQALPAISDIHGALSCDNGRIVITVAPDNSLRLNGTVSLTLQGRAVVDMSAEPPPGPLFELFVDFLGQPRDGKRFQIRFRA